MRAQLKAERAERTELEERAEAAEARIESLTEKLRRAREIIAQSAGSSNRDEATKAALSELQRRNEELQRELAETRERVAVAEESGAAQLGRAMKAEARLREAEETNARLRRESVTSAGGGSRIVDKDKPLPPLPPAAAAATPSAPDSPLPSSPLAASARDSTASVDTGARFLVPRCGAYGAAADDSRAEGTELLLHLVLHPAFALPDALLSCTAATESDRIVRALLTVLAARDRGLELVLHVLRSEVAATPAESYSTFLRANSFATKLGVQFLRKAALPWISAALRAPLDAMMRAPLAVEVDAHKDNLTPAAVAANAKNLRTLTKSFLDSLYTVLDQAPPAVTALATTLRELVERKFPGKGTTALGAFFFLRIFCPAICAPEAWALLPPDRLQPDHRRALVLVTKVLQSMANDVELGKKEDYMSVMNDFLLAQQPGLAAFLNALASPPARPMPDAPRDLTDEELAAAVYDLHSQLVTVQAKVAATLDHEADVAALDMALDRLPQPIRPPGYKRA